MFRPERASEGQRRAQRATGSRAAPSTGSEELARLCGPTIPQRAAEADELTRSQLGEYGLPGRELAERAQRAEPQSYLLFTCYSPDNLGAENPSIPYRIMLR